MQWVILTEKENKKCKWKKLRKCVLDTNITNVEWFINLYKLNKYFIEYVNKQRKINWIFSALSLAKNK